MESLINGLFTFDSEWINQCFLMFNIYMFIIPHMFYKSQV